MYVLFSPAKLNLFLEVKSRRKDGFHDIETVFTRIGLYDVIYLDITDGSGKIYLTMKLGIGEEAIDLPVENNLAYMAADLYLKEARIYNKDLVLKIIKHIPMGAGLGGGSSNAAIVLKALNNYFCSFNQQRLLSIAGRLGSDISFFLLDKTYAVGRGKGDILSPVDLGYKQRFVVIFPNIRVSTKKIYSALKLTYQPLSVKICVLENKGNCCDFCFNRLFDIAKVEYPVLSKVSEKLYETTGQEFFLTGTGSAFFRPYVDDNDFNWASLVDLVNREGWHLWCVDSV